MRQQTWNRLTFGTALVALMVSVIGSPLGTAAVSVIGFAKNAGAVDGIKASRKPRPGFLLPLDRHGKLPASVGAVGATGAKGDAGAKGDPGLKGDPGAPGPSDAYAAALPISTNVTATTTIMSEVVPPGSYSLLSTIALSNQDPAATNSGQETRSLQVGGTGVASNYATMGPAGSASFDAEIALLGAATVTSTTTISVQCSKAAGTASQIDAYNGGILATRVGTLH